MISSTLNPKPLSVGLVFAIIVLPHLALAQGTSKEFIYLNGKLKVIEIGGPQSISGVFGSGLNNSGSGLASLGSTDVRWTLASSADSTYPGPSAIVATHPPSNWVANLTDAQWIAPEDNPN